MYREEVPVPMEGKVVRGIDPIWLDGLFREHPAEHALAVWDRKVWPDAVEFRTLFEEGRPTAYLLFWQALPGCPVVHWCGRALRPEALLKAFPEPPFLAIVPPEVEPALRARCGPAESYPVRLRSRRPGPTAPAPTGRARRLRSGDLGELRRLAAEDGSSVTDTYLSIDPERDWVVGAFDGARLLTVARAEVRLPEIWHISGVFTVPSERRRGHGRAVMELLIEEAARRGAATGLFVRDDNPPARLLYDRLGFSPGEGRVWVDAGAHRPP